MTKIGFIIPYIGKWPIWFPAFLTSCSGNSNIDWIFFSDCEIPSALPSNVIIHKSSLAEIKNLIERKIRNEVNLKSPRKFCDLKPAYGHIFEDYLSNYDFWGFCDIDIIWGNIRSFITEDLLSSYDLISSRKNAVSGHFTILRNNLYCKNLYKTDGIYKDAYLLEKFQWFDETTFTQIVFNKYNHGEIRVSWDKYLVNFDGERDSHQDYYLDKWLYENGKLYDLGINSNQKNEHMYLHFINWKKTMSFCNVRFTGQPSTFYISYNGIDNDKNNLLNRIAATLVRKFYGYERRIKISKLKTKFKKSF